MTRRSRKSLLSNISVSAGMLALCTLPAVANPISSGGDVVLLPGEPGASGGQISGATVTAEISIGGGIDGVVSNITGGGFEDRGGYTGQLYDVTSLALGASPTSVDEGSTRQLSAHAVMGDATTLALAGTEVAWSVVNGALAGIDANGVASAASVFEDTAATARGNFAGIDGDLTLTVLDSDPDNFGSYAGDQIDDDWQVGFFGAPPNANAAPTVDIDGDDRDNLFEFLSGFSPINGDSFFDMTLEGFTAPGTLDISLNKVVEGRTYTLKANTDLSTAYLPVGAPFSVATEESDKLLQDTAAGVRKFYKIDISKP